jgi:hypothetical protein
VDLLGVSASHHGQANDGILVDPNQATGLADPTIFLEMLEDRHRFVLGEFAAVQGGALAFGETVLASAAGQDPGGFAGSVAEANPQVVQTSATVVGALGVLAAEDFQVVHSSWDLPSGRKKVASQLGLP